MLILGIESSCDETAFAVVENGTRVLSNAIASQIELHARFGGVVPEIASRAHLECSVPLYHEALRDAGVSIDDIDAIAITAGPGLAGCLLVGVEFGKALALRHGKPLVAAHHIAGHLYSVYLGRERNAWGTETGAAPEPCEPYVALVVSGGHSSLVLVRDFGKYEVLGETLDDAVGEAYDKVAKLLGLGYPGGPLMDKFAATGNATRFDLPRPLLHKGEFNFSFSGLKTAVSREVEKFRAEHSDGAPLPDDFVADMAASFQAAAVEVLVEKAARAMKKHRVHRLAVTGGVACNRGLRAAVATRFPNAQIGIPAPEYCTDNAAMIAGVGFQLYQQGRRSDLALNATPGMGLY